jgi:hypothetical protein
VRDLTLFEGDLQRMTAIGNGIDRRNYQIKPSSASFIELTTPPWMLECATFEVSMEPPDYRHI